MHLRELDLNLLVVLDALLESRSIKGAGSELGLSPSATSHALSRLRDAFGDALLVRAGQSMALTPHAERLRPRLRRALEELEGVFQSDEAFDVAGLDRSFRIAATDYAELVLLGSVSDGVADVAPGVTLHLQSFARDAHLHLREGRYDVAVGVFGTLAADIHRQPLFPERFVCLLRRGHPAAARRLTLRRYAALDHVLISSRGDARGIVDIHLEAAGLERRVARTVSSFYTAPRLVAHSDYVLTLPERLARHVAEGLALEIRTPPLELPGFQLEMVWHRRSESDPAHRWLRQQMAAVASQLQTS